MERVGLNARDIHGDLDQAQRTKALDAFKAGEIDFLVATDVAARGLDIARLPCVINYDVPIHADDYVHRIGRTGRAGREGRAFTLALPEEGRFVDAITKLTGKQMPRLEIGGMEQPDMADEPQGRRRRGRAHKDTQPAPPEPSRSEAPRSETRPAAEDAATSTDRPSRRGRGRRGRGEPRPSMPRPSSGTPAQKASPERPAPSSSPPASKQHKHRGRGPEQPPIVGMGAHVPLFMRRPVPTPRPVDKPGEE